MGIVLLPIFMIHAELARGTLMIVDVGISAEGTEMYLAYPIK